MSDESEGVDKLHRNIGSDSGTQNMLDKRSDEIKRRRKRIENCRICGGPFEEGQEIIWEPGKGRRHRKCVEALQSSNIAIRPHAREMTAKFEGICGVCNSRIEIGDKILWEEGKKPCHVECGNLPEDEDDT